MHGNDILVTMGLSSSSILSWSEEWRGFSTFSILSDGGLLLLGSVCNLLLSDQSGVDSLYNMFV